ncbi:MAG: HEAT repeat domain-containing protein [Fimbriimonadaceae bacterium]|nr:HEAT repeat domain-containing protein [Fimbriimonadaceae bacterium]
MAIKARQRGRPAGRSSSFQRRLTWREIDEAFDHLFDVSLYDAVANQILQRFRRSRSQLVPVLSSMVVSPYEQERLVAHHVVGRIGGLTTLKMLDDVLADEDVHEALKLDVRGLRALLEPLRASAAEEDEDEEELAERPDRRPARETADGDDEDEPEADEAEPDAARPKPKERRAGRGRGRGRRRGEGGGEPEAEPTTAEPIAPAAGGDLPPVDARLFEGAVTSFLAALDGPLEPLLTLFATIPLPKRLSFIDRCGRLADPRVLRFLLPMVESSDWSVVQSALRALGVLGDPAALPAVEKLAGEAGRKRVQERAARVRDHLREVLAARGGEATVEPPVEPAEEPSVAPPKRRPRSKQAGREAAVAAPGGPVVEPVRLAPPDPYGLRPARGEAWSAPSRLPRAVASWVGPVRVDGYQELVLCRAAGDQAADQLSLLLHDQGGWLAADLTRAVPLAEIQAEAARPTRVEVTIAAFRRRVQEAADVSEAAGRPLPRDAAAALAWIGRGRGDGVEPLPEAGEAASPVELDSILALPLLCDWRATLGPQDDLVQRWLSTSGKRSASRVRRRLIDEGVGNWCVAVGPARLARLLTAQAQLLLRAGERRAAEVLQAAAVACGSEATAVDDSLLRELTYRGFLAGLDAVYSGRRRARQHSLLRAARQRQARSSFRRARRR